MWGNEREGFNDYYKISDQWPEDVDSIYKDWDGDLLISEEGQEIGRY